MRSEDIGSLLDYCRGLGVQNVGRASRYATTSEPRK
jgi:hypothetical protein